MTYAAGEPGRGSNDGAALVTAVLIAFLAMMAAHTMLVFARAELVAARSHRDALLREVGRDRIVERWLDGVRSGALLLPDSTDPDTMVVVDSIAFLGGVTSTLRVGRLATDVWWLTARSTTSTLREDVGVAVRRIDADSAVRTARVAVEVDAGLVSASVPGIGASEPCPDDEVEPSVAPMMARPAFSRGALSPAAVESWREVLEPVPDSVGRLLTDAPCDDPWHWGDPSGGTCPHEAVARYRSGSLTLTGGWGGAVLLVDGDVELRSTTVYGLVIATGVLRLSRGARLVGLARVGAGVTVSDSSGIHGSACWARAALVRSDAVNPHRISGWVPIGPSTGL